MKLNFVKVEEATQRFLDLLQQRREQCREDFVEWENKLTEARYELLKLLITGEM